MNIKDQKEISKYLTFTLSKALHDKWAALFLWGLFFVERNFRNFSDRDAEAEAEALFQSWKKRSVKRSDPIN